MTGSPPDLLPADAPASFSRFQRVTHMLMATCLGVMALIVGSEAMPEGPIPCRRVNDALVGDFQT